MQKDGKKTVDCHLHPSQILPSLIGRVSPGEPEQWGERPLSELSMSRKNSPLKAGVVVCSARFHFFIHPMCKSVCFIGLNKNQT